MDILNKPMPRPELVETLKAMDDSALLAQEITQKAALHAVTHLMRLGVTEANARAMQHSLGTYAAEIATECRRRGLPTVTDPRSS